MEMWIWYSVIYASASALAGKLNGYLLREGNRDSEQEKKIGEILIFSLPFLLVWSLPLCVKQKISPTYTPAQLIERQRTGSVKKIQAPRKKSKGNSSVQMRLEEKEGTLHLFAQINQNILFMQFLLNAKRWDLKTDAFESISLEQVRTLHEAYVNDEKAYEKKITKDFPHLATEMKEAFEWFNKTKKVITELEKNPKDSFYQMLLNTHEESIQNVYQAIEESQQFYPEVDETMLEMTVQLLDKLVIRVQERKQKVELEKQQEREAKRKALRETITKELEFHQSEFSQHTMQLTEQMLSEEKIQNGLTTAHKIMELSHRVLFYRTVWEEKHQNKKYRQKNWSTLDKEKLYQLMVTESAFDSGKGFKDGMEYREKFVKMHDLNMELAELLRTLENSWEGKYLYVVDRYSEVMDRLLGEIPNTPSEIEGMDVQTLELTEEFLGTIAEQLDVYWSAIELEKAALKVEKQNELRKKMAFELEYSEKILATEKEQVASISQKKS